MPSFARGTLKQHGWHAHLHLQGEQQGCYQRPEPPTGHIPLISSRRDYLLSKVRGGGGGGPRCTPRRTRSPSPPRNMAESPLGLGEGGDGSEGGGGGESRSPSRGCGDAAAARAARAAAEMEEVARLSSTGATKTGAVFSPPTTATHATTWTVHPSSPPEGWDDAQSGVRGPPHPGSQPVVAGDGLGRAELGRHQVVVAGADRQAQPYP